MFSYTETTLSCNFSLRYIFRSGRIWLKSNIVNFIVNIGNSLQNYNLKGYSLNTRFDLGHYDYFNQYIKYFLNLLTPTKMEH